MTASQPNLLELAKQSNVQAIAALINRQLQPQLDFIQSGSVTQQAEPAV